MSFSVPLIFPFQPQEGQQNVSPRPPSPQFPPQLGHSASINIRLLMVGLLALAVGAEIVWLGTFQTLRKNTRREIFSWLIILALPASDHRHGVDGGQAIAYCVYIQLLNVHCCPPPLAAGATPATHKPLHRLLHPRIQAISPNLRRSWPGCGRRWTKFVLVCTEGTKKFWPLYRRYCSHFCK